MKATEQILKDGQYVDKENGLVFDKGTWIDIRHFGETVKIEMPKQ
jgi:hypothetical protein